MGSPTVRFTPLMALTVVIIYRTTGHLNFAQGEMAMFSAFFRVRAPCRAGPASIWLAIFISVVLPSMIGAAGIERVIIRPVESQTLSVVFALCDALANLS